MINKFETASLASALISGGVIKALLSTVFLILLNISFGVNAATVKIEYSAEVWYSDANTAIPIGATITGSYLYNTADDFIQNTGSYTRHRFAPSINTQSLININGDVYENSYVDVNVADNTLSGGRDDIFFGSILSNIDGVDWSWALRFRDTTTGTVGQLVTDDSLPSIDFYNSFLLGTIRPPQAHVLGIGSGGYTIEAEVSSISAEVVPIPAAAWLFGSGLIGLMGFASSKRV